MKYKTKQVEIEAIEWDGTQGSFDAIVEMIGSKWKPGEMGSDSFFIETLEGDMKASKGDFIIKGLKGEFYPCRSDIFHLKYEKVD